MFFKYQSDHFHKKQNNKGRSLNVTTAAGGADEESVFIKPNAKFNLVFVAFRSTLQDGKLGD